MTHTVGATIVVVRGFCRGQNPSPKGENFAYFPRHHPKIIDFRRTSNARPYSSDGNCAFLVKSNIFY